MTRKRPYTPRPSKRRPIPADFAELAPTMTIKGAAAHFHASPETIKQWLVATGTQPAPQRVDVRPMPEDFPTLAQTMTVTGLVEHYHTHPRAVRRWLAEAEMSAKPAPTREEMLETLAANRAAQRTRQREWSVRKTWAPYTNTHRDVSLEGQAADFLRGYARTPIYRCRERGSYDPDGGWWRFGNVVLSGEELISRARRHGWAPESWRHIPQRAEVRA